MTSQTARELVVVANRLPVRRVGESGWERSPGGLVSALEPAVRSSHTTWIGWTGVADDQTAAFELDDLVLVPVRISADEEAAFYGGFSNSTLWPLYHDAIFVPQFHREWYEVYERVNRRFAVAAAETAPPGATVWIHDYQLHLVPAMLRELRPDVRIGFFLHIPFPSQELYMRLPWRNQLAAGLLGADVVGFQTVVGAANFRQICRRLLGARVAGSTVALPDGRHVLVSTYPVGIDAERFAELAADPAIIEQAAHIRRELGNPATVLLGVDRLDYTKGIEVRLRAFRELLEDGRLDPEQTVLVQIAQPSRDDVPGYAEIRQLVEQKVGRINGTYGRLGGSVVKYLHHGQSMQDLVALYVAADVMLVTPFRDGMNLVAKEYVACRLDHTGMLVLSEFAGAAHQLHRACLVNPFDVAGLKEAIQWAVSPAGRHEKRRMRALAKSVHEADADWWASTFLADLESPGR